MTKDNASIAYFSMEVGINHNIPTYSGGLGILAGDTLKGFADLGVHTVGITMLNEKGYFYQKIDKEGNQIEEDVQWDPNESMTLMPNEVTVHIQGRPVKIRAWKHLIHGHKGHIVPVYFLDTNIEGNSEADRNLTAHLYGGDRAYRLSQEIILGIGGIRMLESLGYHTLNKYHMNEGHAALLTIELLKKKYAGNQEEVRKHCVFTTHTPVAAGHDRFDEGLFNDIIGGKEYIPPNVYEQITREGKVNMTLLGLNLSGHINGVAKRHGEVTKHMFPEHSNQIDAITNGVHHLTWASPEMAKLFDKYIPDWRADPFSLRNALCIPNELVYKAHEDAKKRLMEEVNKRTGANYDHRRFTIGFARRFTAYKRPDMLLFDFERLKRLAEEVGDIQVIFAGKAHKQDQQGKDIIKRIVQTSKWLQEQGLKLQIVFLSHYDMELSRKLVAGCDIWLNNPQRPFEASGTSGMKAALNGTPQVSTLDGWWLEGHIEGTTGWQIGPSPGDPAFDDDPTPDDEANDFYNKLRYTVIPLYYKDKEGWARVMKHAIALNGSFFNTQRMVQQYVSTCYVD